ncbi:SnoaL-like domain-containing protein [Joostella sp. CR20]|uniref:SnoaL-like domain-containing protein n=1 Tax=Joostella sp. CR20 TaxID=2804312 RepID=UPI00313E1567
MNTKQIAERFVSLCRQGLYLQVYHELYDINAISSEIGFPKTITTEGKHNIVNDYLENEENIVAIHRQFISDPLIADHYFVVKMTSDITFSDIGRQEMEELCLYKVENNLISEAQFFYSPMETAPFNANDLKNKKSLEEELFV